jgi:hypothetical protein
LLLGAMTAFLPLSAFATAIYTPHELREAYRKQVRQSLHVPQDEVRLYGGISELQLFGDGRELLAPQYVLVIDRNAHVQAAFLFWRLVAGSYELIGASPVSTSAAASGPVTEQLGLFEAGAALGGVECDRRLSSACRTRGIHDPGGHHVRHGSAATRALWLRVRGADREAERHLGRPCAEDCIVLPASLIRFLDGYGVLSDGTDRPQRHVLPYRGRYLLLVDSERDERPSWSPPPVDLTARL